MLSFLLCLILAGPSRAAPVAVPPEGATEIGLLICAEDGCPDRMFWISFEPAFEDLPVVAVEALMAEDTVATGDDVQAQAFDDALERARAAVLAGHWATADGALDDAESILEAWTGSPDNQALFDLWFLRGAAREVTAPGTGAGAFAQAAAVTWNRSVQLPDGLDAYRQPYYDALARLLSQGVGTLVIEDPGARAEHQLDGVALGDAPLKLQVLPGRHRLTAQGRRYAEDWKVEVDIRPGRTTTTRALFPGEASDRWAADGLSAAFDNRYLDPQLAELLERWAERHALRTIRLLRLDPEARPTAPDAIEQEAGTGLPVFELRQLWYDPRLRRFSQGPPG